MLLFPFSAVMRLSVQHLAWRNFFHKPQSSAFDTNSLYASQNQLLLIIMHIYQ